MERPPAVNQRLWKKRAILPTPAYVHLSFNGKQIAIRKGDPLLTEHVNGVTKKFAEQRDLRFRDERRKARGDLHKALQDTV